MLSRSSRRALPCAVALALVLAGAEAAPRADFDAAGYEKAITSLLCDCGCHPQSVKDCACGRAAEMRREIAGLIEAGGPNGAPMTGEQVVARYVAEQGTDILVVPEARGFNLVAWLGPLIGLVGASFTMVLVLRRLTSKRAVPATEPPLLEAPALAGDDLYRARLRRAVQDHE